MTLDQFRSTLYSPKWQVTGFTENNPNHSTHKWQIPLLHQPYLPGLRSTSFLLWHKRWLEQKMPAANINLHFAKLSHNDAKALEAWLSSSPVKSWTFVKFCHCVAVWQLGDVDRQMTIKVRQNLACNSTGTQVTEGERPMRQPSSTGELSKFLEALLEHEKSVWFKNKSTTTCSSKTICNCFKKFLQTWKC